MATFDPGDSGLMLENTGHRKPVFWHILGSDAGLVETVHW